MDADTDSVAGHPSLSEDGSETLEMKRTNSVRMRIHLDNEWNRSKEPPSLSVLVNQRRAKDLERQTEENKSEAEEPLPLPDQEKKSPRAVSTSALDAIFPFMDLPLEIRTMILEFAVSSPRLLFLNTISTQPIARVCRQLRSESLPLHVSTNKIGILFSNTVPGSDEYSIEYDKVTESWIKQLDPSKPLFHDVAYSLQRTTMPDEAGLNRFAWDFYIKHTGKQTSLHHGGVCPICASNFDEDDEQFLKALHNPVIIERHQWILKAARQDHDQLLSKDPLTLELKSKGNGVSLNDLEMIAGLYEGPSEWYVGAQHGFRRFIEKFVLFSQEYSSAETPEEKSYYLRDIIAYARAILKMWTELRLDILAYLPEHFHGLSGGGTSESESDAESEA